ncbi:MAG TPA: type III secretion HpaP family protein [Roseateles sp.]
MTHTDARRPLRVLSAEELAQLRLQQNQAPRSAAQLATQQSADRFRRTLAGPARRTESGPPPAASASPAATVAARPAGAGAGSAPLQAVVRHLPEGDEPPGTEPLSAAMPWLDLAAQPLLEGDAAASATGDQPALPDLPHDPWPEQMAQTIADLCARSAPSFVNWTVTLPMDPQVLPETDLRLSLSQHWLSLRFITQSPQSHHLVCRHRQRLLEQLERLPQLPHGIDIEVT